MRQVLWDLVSRINMIQVLGLSAIMHGMIDIKRRRIPYGWRGRPPSGYLTGIDAVVFGIISIGLGLWFLLDPTGSVTALSWKLSWNR